MKLAALLLTAALAGCPASPRAAGEEAIPAFDGSAHQMHVVATAYTSGPESTGKRPGHPAYGLTATGTRAREGRTIAVDPQLISLGSLVYIAELGESRIAEDTGGDIVGSRIDIYMERVEDALAWGRRPVKVSVFPRI